MDELDTGLLHFGDLVRVHTPSLVRQVCDSLCCNVVLNGRPWTGSEEFSLTATVIIPLPNNGHGCLVSSLNSTATVIILKYTNGRNPAL